MTVAALGHGASERMAVAKLAVRLGRELPKVKFVLARRESDPYKFV
jgi:hypothetical protein